MHIVYNMYVAYTCRGEERSHVHKDGSQKRLLAVRNVEAVEAGSEVHIARRGQGHLGLRGHQAFPCRVHLQVRQVQDQQG